MKEWAQLARKWHRWFAIPMFVLVPFSVLLKFSGNGNIVKDVPAVEAVQSLLLLLLVLTGAYLYIFRVVNRRKRLRRSAGTIARSSQSSV